MQQSATSHNNTHTNQLRSMPSGGDRSQPNRAATSVGDGWATVVKRASQQTKPTASKQPLPNVAAHVQPRAVVARNQCSKSRSSKRVGTLPTVKRVGRVAAPAAKAPSSRTLKQRDQRVSFCSMTTINGDEAKHLIGRQGRTLRKLNTDHAPAVVLVQGQKTDSILKLVVRGQHSQAECDLVLAACHKLLEDAKSKQRAAQEEKRVKQQKVQLMAQHLDKLARLEALAEKTRAEIEAQYQEDMAAQQQAAEALSSRKAAAAQIPLCREAVAVAGKKLKGLQEQVARNRLQRAAKLKVAEEKAKAMEAPRPRGVLQARTLARKSRKRQLVEEQEAKRLGKTKELLEARAEKEKEKAEIKQLPEQLRKVAQEQQLEESAALTAAEADLRTAMDALSKTQAQAQALTQEKTRRENVHRLTCSDSSVAIACVPTWRWKQQLQRLSGTWLQRFRAENPLVTVDVVQAQHNKRGVVTVQVAVTTTSFQGFADVDDVMTKLLCNCFSELCAGCLTVPNEKAGCLIGAKGSTLKKLEEENPTATLRLEGNRGQPRTLTVVCESQDTVDWVLKSAKDLCFPRPVVQVPRTKPRFETLLAVQPRATTRYAQRTSSNGPRNATQDAQGRWWRRRKHGQMEELRQDTLDRCKRWYSWTQFKRWYCVKKRRPLTFVKQLWEQMASKPTVKQDDSYRGPVRRLMIINGKPTVVEIDEATGRPVLAANPQASTKSAASVEEPAVATASVQEVQQHGDWRSGCIGKATTVRYHCPDVRAFPAA